MDATNECREAKKNGKRNGLGFNIAHNTFTLWVLFFLPVLSLALDVSRKLQPNKMQLAEFVVVELMSAKMLFSSPARYKIRCG